MSTGTATFLFPSANPPTDDNKPPRSLGMALPGSAQQAQQQLQKQRLEVEELQPQPLPGQDSSYPPEVQKRIEAVRQRLINQVNQELLEGKTKEVTKSETVVIDKGRPPQPPIPPEPPFNSKEVPTYPGSEEFDMGGNYPATSGSNNNTLRLKEGSFSAHVEKGITYLGPNPISADGSPSMTEAQVLAAFNIDNITQINPEMIRYPGQDPKPGEIIIQVNGPNGPYHIVITQDPPRPGEPGSPGIPPTTVDVTACAKQSLESGGHINSDHVPGIITQVVEGQVRVGGGAFASYGDGGFGYGPEGFLAYAVTPNVAVSAVGRQVFGTEDKGSEVSGRTQGAFGAYLKFGQEAVANREGSITSSSFYLGPTVHLVGDTLLATTTTVINTEVDGKPDDPIIYEDKLRGTAVSVGPSLGFNLSKQAPDNGKRYTLDVLVGGAVDVWNSSRGKAPTGGLAGSALVRVGLDGQGGYAKLSAGVEVNAHNTDYYLKLAGGLNTAPAKPLEVSSGALGIREDRLSVVVSERNIRLTQMNARGPDSGYGGSRQLGEKATSFPLLSSTVEVTKIGDPTIENVSVSGKVAFVTNKQLINISVVAPADSNVKNVEAFLNDWKNKVEKAAEQATSVARSVGKQPEDGLKKFLAPGGSFENYSEELTQAFGGPPTISISRIEDETTAAAVLQPVRDEAAAKAAQIELDLRAAQAAQASQDLTALRQIQSLEVKSSTEPQLIYLVDYDGNNILAAVTVNDQSPDALLNRNDPLHTEAVLQEFNALSEEDKQAALAQARSVHEALKASGELPKLLAQSVGTTVTEKPVYIVVDGATVTLQPGTRWTPPPPAPSAAVPGAPGLPPGTIITRAVFDGSEQERTRGQVHKLFINQS